MFVVLTAQKKKKGFRVLECDAIYTGEYVPLFQTCLPLVLDYPEIYSTFLRNGGGYKPNNSMSHSTRE